MGLQKMIFRAITRSNVEVVYALLVDYSWFKVAAVKLFSSPQLSFVSFR